MEERRKFKRYPTLISMTIESLYKQDNVKIEDVNGDISVLDVSKTGLGFASKHVLPVDYYFNAKIVFDEEKFFYSVLKIIRIVKQDNDYHYGCEFVGLADVLSCVVDDYGHSIE